LGACAHACTQAHPNTSVTAHTRKTLHNAYTHAQTGTHIHTSQVTVFCRPSSKLSVNEPMFSV